MHCLPIVYCILVFLGLIVCSISLSTDDFDFNELLLDDSVQPFLGAEDENDFWSTTTSDATLGNPCLATNDQDMNQEEDAMSLFSRADGGPQCLPPVNIGAETLQLFEAPFDTLNNFILPLNENTQAPDPPPPGESPPGALPPLRYPGLLPEGETGQFNREDLEKQGYRPYTGPMYYEKEKDTCEELTALYGSYPHEVCCDAHHVGYGAQSPSSRSILQRIDAQTIENQDIAVIYNCIRTFAKSSEILIRGLDTILSNMSFSSTAAIRTWACPAPYIRYRLCCNTYVSLSTTLLFTHVQLIHHRGLGFQLSNSIQLFRSECVLSRGAAIVISNHTWTFAWNGEK